MGIEFEVRFVVDSPQSVAVLLATRAFFLAKQAARALSRYDAHSDGVLRFRRSSLNPLRFRIRREMQPTGSARCSSPAFTVSAEGVLQGRGTLSF